LSRRVSCAFGCPVLSECLWDFLSHMYCIFYLIKAFLKKVKQMWKIWKNAYHSRVIHLYFLKFYCNIIQLHILYFVNITFSEDNNPLVLKIYCKYIVKAGVLPLLRVSQFWCLSLFCVILFFSCCSKRILCNNIP